VLAKVSWPRPLWVVVRQPVGLPSLACSNEELGIKLVGTSVAICGDAGL
jgi:hypothetical protein